MVEERTKNFTKSRTYTQKESTEEAQTHKTHVQVRVQVKGRKKQKYDVKPRHMIVLIFKVKQEIIKIQNYHYC